LDATSPKHDGYDKAGVEEKLNQTPVTKHPLIRTSSPAGILKCVESLKHAREEEQLTMVQEDALSGDGTNDKKQHLIERLDKSKDSKGGKRSRDPGKVLHPDLVKAKQQDQAVSKKSLYQPVLLGTAFDHLGRSPSKPSNSTKNKEQAKSITSFINP